jgi:hypothetical protein
MALGQAAFLAFGTAMESMGGKSSAIATAGLARVDGAMITTAATAGGAATALKGTEMAMFALGQAMKAAGWIAALAAAATAIVAIGDAIYRATDPMGAMTSRAESLLGGFAGLQDAVTSDTLAMKENAKAAGMTEAAYAQSQGIILAHTTAVEGNDTAAQDAITAHNNMLMILGEEPGYYAASSNAIATQTLAIGSNTMAWLKNAIAQSKTFQDLAKNKDAMAALSAGGFNITDATNAAINGKLDAYKKKFTELVKFDTGGENWWKNTPLGIFEQAKAGGAKQGISDLMDVVGGAYNEMLLLGLGSEDAAKKVSKAFDVPTSTVRELAKNTKKTVKTVVDYASQMVSIFKRIDDIKFSKQAGLDEIASAWQSIKDSAAEAADAVKKANESIAGLTADKGILEYKLSVAVRYGDEKRANVLRAELAKKTTEIADANAELTKAQSKSSTALEGNTEAAITNRSTMVGLLGNYQSYIQALMATGVKGTALEKEITNLKSKFVDQGTALGFNAKELSFYTDQFDQYAKAVHDTPRDVTIEFDASKTDEFNAVQEYLAKEHLLNVKIVYDKNGVANSGGTNGGGAGGATGGAGGDTGLVKQPAGTGSGLTVNSAGNLTYDTSGSKIPASVNTMAELAYYQRKVTLEKSILTIQDNLNRAAAGRASTATIAALKSQLSAAKAKLASGNFASGGYVSGPGTGTSDSIPAMLSNGEYVVRASAVRAYGVDYMNSLNQMKTGSMPMSMGAGGSNGSQVVYLSPDDRALLRAAIDRPVNLFAETGKIASSANAGNVLIAQRGLN